MITVNAVFGQEQKSIGMLGRVGENETRQIVFDCSDILAEYPGAEIVCVMQRHCDRIAYLADAVLAGNVLTVTLTDADVSASGDLRIELRALADGKIRKSAVYMGQVVSALRGEQDRPGNPTTDMLNRIDSTLQSATETQKKLLSALDGVDTAVDGANAAANNAQTIADTVQAKLDNGDFVGPAGKPGSDASVTTENIQAALGYTPVKDVRLNGVSLVHDSAATIPLAGYNRLGAVQLDPAGFAAASVEGKLALVPPTDAQISTHTHTQRPITPSCMDYAVKAAMCDGKGAAWTDAEKKAARDRMGVPGDYELIEEIVLNEAVTQVVRTNMSLAEMRIVVEVPVSDSVSAVAIEVYSESTLIGYAYIGNLINKENIKMAKFMVKRDRGTYVFSTVSTNANSAAQKAGVGTLSETAALFPVGNAVTKISLYSTSNAIILPIGTKITIEGETI